MSEPLKPSEQPCLPAGYPFKPQYEITPCDAARLLRDEPGAFILLDCRTKDEFDLVHVPGSLHIAMHEIEERWHEIEVGPGQRVGVICHHGQRSLRTALALRAIGVHAAHSVAGGIDLWSQVVDPALARYEHRGGRFAIVQAQNPGGQ